MGLLVICAGGCAAKTVTLYQRIEETMTNTSKFANPFRDTELRLDVAAPAGRRLGSSFTWHGFHDGDGAGHQDGKIWKFRLLLDQPGPPGEYAVTRYRCAELERPVTLPAVRGGAKVNLGPTPTTGFGHDYLFVITSPP